jgi:hypothetical protein
MSRLQWAGHVVGMRKEEMLFSVWKPVEERALGKTGKRWKDNTFDLKELCCEDGKWTVCAIPGAVL